MTKSLFAALLSLGLAGGLAGAAGAARAQDDIAAGQHAFTPCKLCHSLDPGKNGIGPSLAGVVGRKAGTAPNFAYSDAMKSSGITWDESSLNDYLKNPKAKVPGTKMVFAGVADDDARAALVKFLAAKAK
jgi:cytochrome c